MLPCSLPHRPQRSRSPSPAGASFPPQRLHLGHFFQSLPSPSSNDVDGSRCSIGAPVPTGAQHRSGLINPRWAPECPSQPHVSHPPGRVPACLRGQCHGPSAAPAVPDAAWACGAGGPHGGHPDFEGQLPPGAPGELQAGRSRGHLWGSGPSGVLGLWDVGAAACCGMGLQGRIHFGSQHQEPLENP